MYVSGWLLCCHESKYLQDPLHVVLSWPDHDDIFQPGLDSLQRQLTTVVSSRIIHNEGAENTRRQTDKETGQNVQRLMAT